MRAPRLSGRGLAAGAAAFTIWGMLPIYLYELKEVPALQIIAHRIGIPPRCGEQALHAIRSQVSGMFR
jgi:EamA domain-containing membrane protein RarD